MCYHSVNRIPQKPESFESSSLFFFLCFEKKSSATLKMWWQRLNCL